jgi:formylglycine-generating enzyme required for sulfatase activity
MDMAGNVSEWTLERGRNRYWVCGGCIDDEGDETAAMCAGRQKMPPTMRGKSLGFRVLRILD